MKKYAILDINIGEFLNVDYDHYGPVHECTFFDDPEYARMRLLHPDDMLAQGREEVVVPVTFVVGEPVEWVR